MKYFKMVTSLILISVMCAAMCSCVKKPAASTNTDGNNWRKPVSKGETAKFVDTDGDFKYKSVDWNGPDGYNIIYPKGINDAKETAEILRTYYKALGVELSVKDDSAKAEGKEILVGNTNRQESKHNLKESELSVSLQGEKLVFTGGHSVTLKSAVEKFVRLAPQKQKAVTFKLTTDFKSTMLDGYKYVWGDEFEGTDIDLLKWDFEERMGDSTKVQISWEKDVINVADGRLKLHAINTFNPLREGTLYKVPYSVVTRYSMNYTYGYAEIRARVPFYKGSWPSFWAMTVNGMSGRKSIGGVAYDEKKSLIAPYSVEVDIFEVFGNESKIVPNAHKHYNSNNYNYDQIHGIKQGNHTVISPVKIWDWASKDIDLSNLSNEYHTYGFEWNKKEMSFYVDGEKYFTMDIVNSFDKNKDMSLFHEPIFLMFNNHVFADDMSYYENLIEDHSIMPFCYYIDYCRVYQKPGEGKIYTDNIANTYVGR